MRALVAGSFSPGARRQAGEPVVHQKWELPPIAPLIFEYRLHRVRCPGCAKKTLAGLPAGVSASAFGPRLEAHIAMLAGVYRLSRRQVVQVVEEILGCPISTGAVDTAIMRMSRVLADPWQALAEAIRQADVVHADETSWRLAGAQQWLWLGAAALVACYRIDPHRSQAAAKKLLGEDFGGILISDRYAGYHFLDVLQQQLCWCHAIRQLVEISERQGAPGKLGAKLVKAAREVIAVHRRYLQDQRTLPWLAHELSPLRNRIQALLARRRTLPPSEDRKLLRWTARGVRGALDLLRDTRHQPDEQQRRASAPPRRDHAQDPRRHPIRKRQPLDRADPLGQRDLPPTRPRRTRLPHHRRNRRPPRPTRTLTVTPRTLTSTPLTTQQASTP